LASPTVQSQFLLLASVLQLLRGAAWFTAGVILAVQAVDPTVGASLPVLRSLDWPAGALALLAAVLVANSVLQVWAGYHVIMWRRTRMANLALLAASLDFIAWTVLGLRLEARGEFGFALAGFVLAGFAALAAIGVAAGRSSLTGPF